MKPIELEVQLLAIAIFERYGYDFREYATASLARRFEAVVAEQRMNSLAELQDRVIHDPEFFFELLSSLTLTVSEFFRDPEVWSRFRQEIAPYLRTFPSLKLWSAGCSTGEEAYSLAILLQEEGLLDRSIIHATDINPRALEKAELGMFRRELVDTATSWHKDAGGSGALEDYFEPRGEWVKVKPDLKSHILFNHHDLVRESSFGEMAVVFCRNTMIYFQPTLQDRVLRLLHESLLVGGHLVLGSKEGLATMRVREHFDTAFMSERIYRKKPA